MAHEEQTRQRISRRSHVVIVHSEASKMRVLVEVLGAHGEIRITRCRSLHHLSEVIERTRPDACVVQIDTADEIPLLNRLPGQRDCPPLIVMVTPDSDVADELSAHSEVSLISEQQPVTAVRQILLSVLMEIRAEVA